MAPLRFIPAPLVSTWLSVWTSMKTIALKQAEVHAAGARLSSSPYMLRCLSF